MAHLCPHAVLFEISQVSLNDSVAVVQQIKRPAEITPVPRTMTPRRGMRLAGCEYYTKFPPLQTERKLRAPPQQRPSDGDGPIWHRGELAAAGSRVSKKNRADGRRTRRVHLPDRQASARQSPSVRVAASVAIGVRTSPSFDGQTSVTNTASGVISSP